MHKDDDEPYEPVEESTAEAGEYAEVPSDGERYDLHCTDEDRGIDYHVFQWGHEEEGKWIKAPSRSLRNLDHQL